MVVDVAPDHLDRPFTYAVPDGETVGLGQRVRVRFAGRKRVGWVVATTASADTAADRILPLDAVDGERTWFDDADLRLFRWVADRYAAPLAAVLRHALPERVAAVEEELGKPSPAAAAAPPTGAEADAPGAGPWDRYGAGPLLATVANPAGQAFWWRPLPDEDTAAAVAWLVGSALGRGHGALVLGPDPSTPELDAALAVTREVAAGAVADLRAASRRDRYRAFVLGRAGVVRVAVGERGGVFAPVGRLGLVVVVDEANPAYKERRSPRHNAREVALARARMTGAVCLLVGDLPSAAVWRLLGDGHVKTVTADRASERSAAPRVDVDDRSLRRPGTRRTRFGDRASALLREVVSDGGVAVVLAARGGQGAALACRGCGERRRCPACDGSVRPTAQRWECPACGWSDEPFACPVCSDQRTAPLAAGAGRLAQELTKMHPDAEVVRMEGFDAPGPQRQPAVAVMTRGSVVTRPAWLGQRPVDLVVIPDADAMLTRPSLDAGEDALRLWLAVARWTVQGDSAGGGRVLVQTRAPRHPAVQALVRWDPEGFWDTEAERRGALRYPPTTSLVAVQPRRDDAAAIAAELRDALPGDDAVLGPDEEGRLLVKSASLRGTLDALTPLRHEWAKSDRKVRVDVDPVEA